MQNTIRRAPDTNRSCPTTAATARDRVMNAAAAAAGSPKPSDRQLRSIAPVRTDWYFILVARRKDLPQTRTVAANRVTITSLIINPESPDNRIVFKKRS